MYRKLLFGCLLLTVVAELLEARKKFNTPAVQMPPSTVRDLTPIYTVVDGLPTLEVVLLWQAPQQTNGRISGYKVFYTTDATQPDYEWVVEDVEADRLSVSIRNLSFETTYYFKIQARNSVAFGPLSNTVILQTPSASAACGSNFVPCADFSKCVAKSQICDTRKDCPDYSDEENCNENVCEDYEVQCNSGQCLDETQYCETSLNCFDDADIAGVCNDFTCSENKFKCQSDGRCVSRALSLCNYEDDCADGSDESLNVCEPIMCGSSRYHRCPTSNKCVLKIFICDNYNDCGDNSDEAPELCKNRVCDEDEVTCANGQCINTREFCLGTISCNDESRSSEYSTICTRGFRPQLESLQVQALALSSTTVLLTFDNPLLGGDRRKTKLRDYVVRYYSTLEHSIWVNEWRRFGNGSTETATLNNLRPNTQYQFMVRYGDSLGLQGETDGLWSPWSPIAVATTLETAPDSPPRQFAVSSYDRTSSSLTLRWMSPTNTNGRITGYSVRYSTVLHSPDEQWAVHDVNGDMTSTTLHNLAPSTRFFFKVQARNSAGTGPLSTIVVYRTP